MVEKSEPSDSSDSGPEPTAAEITAAIVAWCAWDPTVAEFVVDHPATRAAMAQALRTLLVARAFAKTIAGACSRCGASFVLTLGPGFVPICDACRGTAAAESDACAHARARETPGLPEG